MPLTHVLSLSGLTLLLLFACFANESRHTYKGFARSLWIVCGVAGLIGFMSGNLWVAGFVAVITYNLTRAQKPIGPMPAWLVVISCVGLYAVSKQIITTDLRLAGLWILTSVGVALGVWSIYSLMQYPKSYDHTRIVKGWRLGFWESRDHLLDCGQENHNHTQCLAALTTVASLGLGWLISPWLYLLTPLCLLPIVAVQYTMGLYGHRLTTWTQLTQGFVHLFHAGLAVLWFVTGWWSLLLIVPYVALILWAMNYAKRRLTWVDCGRVHTWMVHLMGSWWQMGWRVRLFGHGWDSWLFFAIKIHRVRQAMGLAAGELLSNAHNEFVQVLFEHGMLGLLCVLGFIAETLYRLSLGGPVELIYAVLGVTLCSIASINHPWTWWRELIHDAPGPPLQEPVNRKERRARESTGQTSPGYIHCAVGSPGLVAVSIFLVVMGG